ncbi:MAG: hypothetical protein MUF53_01865, partial [Gemmatimonadaceae bacterium]|nr:hypothetical protein [Gemmatimonadaceae bacterium]
SAAAPSDPDAETPPAESPPHDAACLVATTCAPMLVAASATLAGLELAPRRHVVDRAPRWRDGVRRAVEPPPPRVA